MNFFDALILGIVEGVTEFLPISSTAHLVIASRVLVIPDSVFLSSFIIAIQLGAIASVIVLFWRTIAFEIETMKRVFVAFLPTAVIGLAAYKLLKDVLIENLTLIAVALLIGGMVIVVFEYFFAHVQHNESEKGEITYRTAFLIGCFQSLAIIPGVSRAGATVVGGMMLGLGRKKIVEFSFLLAVPTMLAATGYDLFKSGASFAIGEWQLLMVGFIVSFLSAYGGIRILMRFIQTHSFSVFGWYRIALGAAILLYLAYA